MKDLLEPIIELTLGVLGAGIIIGIIIALIYHGGFFQDFLQYFSMSAC